MDRDSRLLLILAAFPIMVGSMVAVIVALSRRKNSVECPLCFRRIPKDVVNRRLPCPHCAGVQADGPGPSRTSGVSVAADKKNCHRCAAPLTSSPYVQLWDNRRYCEQCVSNGCPQLFEFVASHKSLESTYPHPALEVTWRMLLFATMGIGGFAILIALLVLLAGDSAAALQGIGVIMLIGLPVILLFSCAAGFSMHCNRPVVSAFDGNIVVRFGMGLLVAPLGECRWFAGRASHTTVLPFGFLLRGEAVVLQLPTTIAKDDNRIAVGFTPESRELWRGFLTLAGVPQISPKMKRGMPVTNNE